MKSTFRESPICLSTLHYLPPVCARHGGLDEGPVVGGAEGEEAGNLLRGEGAPVVLDGWGGASKALGQKPTEPGKYSVVCCTADFGPIM